MWRIILHARSNADPRLAEVRRAVTKRKWKKQHFKEVMQLLGTRRRQ